MKTFTAIEQKIELQQEKLQDWLERMSARERVLVIFTSVFVLLAVVGSALFYMHQAANQQQKRVNQLKDTLVWMQANAVTMKAEDDLQLSTQDKIQRAAQQHSLSVTSQMVGEELHIQTSHNNYVMLANFLTQLAQMGLTIEMLELNEAAGQINLKAVLL